MVRSVFGMSLRHRRWSILGWIAGTLALASFVIALYPVLVDNEAVQNLLQRLPKSMMAMFGVDPALYTTAVGYIQAQLYTVIGPLLVIAFTIGMAAPATAGEEEAGTADLLLSFPIRRERVVIEKFLALASLLLAIVGCFVAVTLFGNAFADLNLPIIGIVGANLGLYLLGLFFGALAMAVGAWTGSRLVAAAAAAGFALGTFFIRGFAAPVEWLQPIAALTPFHWYSEGWPVKEGPTAGHLILAGATGITLVAAIVGFSRRDLGCVPAALARRRRPRNGDDLVRGRTRGGFERLLTSVYGRTLWERRRTMLFWLAGLCGLAALTMSFWPSLRDNQQDFAGVLKLVPKEFFAMFGIGDPETMLTAAGLITSRVYGGPGLLLMLLFTIGMGTAAVAGEEARGTMDLQLSVPMTRHRLVLEKFAAMVTLVVVLVSGLTVVLWSGDWLLDLDLTLTGIIAANLGLGLIGLFFGALSLFVGAVTGRAGLARGIAAAVAIGGFMLNGLGAAFDFLDPVRLISPFYWFLGDSPPLLRGFSWGMIVFVVTTTLLVGASTAAFARRDVVR